ncbi:MAG: heavy-metal-associated domain-containing protein [Anaerolineae bacterium]|nr:heavy-metal-associated domain-containing protein [Anaerolineae bacterium]
MQSKTFVVPAIHCNHCTHTIKMEVGDISGVESVEADVDTRRVTVTWDDPATWDEIKSLLEEINYPPAEPLQVN